MKFWNCRLVELNGEPTETSWVGVRAYSPKEAAEDFCSSSDAWETALWENGFDAVVEVEEMGGESGIHRMRIFAFSAEPHDDENLPSNFLRRFSGCRR